MEKLNELVMPEVCKSKTFLNKIAVITGGASGIGEACVRLLAERGALVIVCDRNAEAGESVAKEHGGLAVTLDVANPEAIAAVAEKIETEIGPVDLLVTSAGIIQSYPAPPEELGIEEWDAITDINLRGTYLCCSNFARGMCKRRRGAIVTIASVMGMRSGPFHAYGPAKAGVIHLTQTLAAEWGRSGVRVNSISPGYVMPPVLARAIEDGMRDVSVMEDSSALGRMVRPEEVAEASCFLLSDAASAVTGINLPVDNGWLSGINWHTYGGVRARR